MADQDKQNKNPKPKSEKRPKREGKPKNKNDDQKAESKPQFKSKTFTNSQAAEPKPQSSNQKNEPKQQHNKPKNPNNPNKPRGDPKQQGKPQKKKPYYKPNTPKNTNSYNRGPFSNANNAFSASFNDQNRNKYSKRKIQSNWDRVELPENIYEFMENESRGANLTELLRKPISIGDHFQFKHEKFWDFDSKSSINNDLFALNLDKIASHVMCVPFYERNNIDKSLFTENDVQRMKNAALMNEMLLNSKGLKDNTDEKLSLDVTNKCKLTDESILNEPPIQLPKLEISSKIEAQDKTEIKVKNNPSDEEEDLEAWLMDYLK